MTATAKTPTVAIARVLRGLGLKQGADFKVRGEYVNGERIGTYVVIYTAAAEQVIAANADEIERLVQLDGGFSFRVSIRYTTGGRLWTWVANYGSRTRDAAPVATADRGGHRVTKLAPVTVAQATAAVEKAAPVLLALKVKLGAPRPAFHQPHPAARAAAAAKPVDPEAHPYEGLAQKPFGSLTWACEEAGQTWFFQNTCSAPRYTLRAYRGRAQVNGWYLSGPGIGQPGSSSYMGATVTIAATAAEAAILAAY